VAADLGDLSVAELDPIPAVTRADHETDVGRLDPAFLEGEGEGALGGPDDIRAGVDQAPADDSA
jgi:hypothetical protein